MTTDKNPAPATPPPAKKEPKPWPMFWIVVAILIYAVIQMAVAAFG